MPIARGCEMSHPRIFAAILTAKPLTGSIASLAQKNFFCIKKKYIFAKYYFDYFNHNETVNTFMFCPRLFAFRLRTGQGFDSNNHRRQLKV